MGRVEGAFVPESEAERDLVEAIAQAMHTAYAEGVAIEDIGGALTFAAGSMLVRGPATDASPHPVQVPDPSGCPGCGGAIDDVVRALGSPPIVRPCGCTVSEDDLPEEHQAVTSDG